MSNGYTPDIRPMLLLFLSVTHPFHLHLLPGKVLLYLLGKNIRKQQIIYNNLFKYIEYRNKWEVVKKRDKKKSLF